MLTAVSVSELYLTPFRPANEKRTCKNKLMNAQRSYTCRHIDWAGCVICPIGVPAGLLCTHCDTGQTGARTQPTYNLMSTSDDAELYKTARAFLRKVRLNKRSSPSNKTTCIDLHPIPFSRNLPKWDERPTQTRFHTSTNNSPLSRNGNRDHTFLPKL